MGCSPRNNSDRMPVDSLAPLGQYCAMLGETRSRLSLTHAAFRTWARPDSNFISDPQNLHKSETRMKTPKSNPMVILTLASAVVIATSATVVQAQSQPGQQPPDSVVAVVADAQDLPFVPPDQRPVFGTFWEVHSSLPCVGAPLPFPPMQTNTPVYAIGDPAVGGQFLVDETAGQVISPQAQYNRRGLSSMTTASIVQAQADELQTFVAQVQAAQASAQLGAKDQMSRLRPDGGGTLGLLSSTPYTLEDLWLEVVTVTNAVGLFVVHPPEVEVTTGVYDLFMTTDLSPNVPGLNFTNWLWLLRTGPGETNLVVPDLTADTGFFILARTNDADGDGMTDAYEQLVSHTNPNTPDGPTIVLHPLGQDVLEGDTVTFSVAALGGGPLTYQWAFNGTNIAGATTTSYSINLVQANDSGGYAVSVTNRIGSVLSQTAQLTVEPGTGNPLLMELKGARDSYTFKPGVTYLLAAGPVELHGTTKLMGGSVLRFDWVTNTTLVVKGALLCDTQPFFPCVLTSIDDDSQGEALFYWYDDGWPLPHAGAGPYLDLTFAGSSDIHDLRICFADIGMSTPASSGRLEVWDCQFVQCNTAITNAVWDFGAVDSLHNVLFAQCGTAIAGTTNSIQIEAEHVTADVTNFLAAPAPAYRMALTNSIIFGTLGDASIVTTQNVALNPSGAVFQSEGYGNYYLAANSQFHRAGTTNLSARLLLEFQHKSTYPPMALPAMLQLNGEMTLLPQVPRYSGGAPDIGFWYEALDYSVANAFVTGRITVEPGTAVAVRHEYVPAYQWVTFVGFDVQAGGSFVSQGMPTRPITFTAEKMVQEAFGGGYLLWQWWYYNEFCRVWLPDAVSFVPDYLPSSPDLPAPTFDFRFSNFYLPPRDYHFASGFMEDSGQAASYDSAMQWTLRDCGVYGGRINVGEAYDGSTPFGSGSVSWMNNLFDGVSINLDPAWAAFYYTNLNCDVRIEAHNNLFRGGLWFHLEPIPASAGNWVLTDNLFDKVNFLQDTVSLLDFAYNAYWPLSSAELQQNQSGYRWFLQNSGQLLTAPASEGFSQGAGELCLTSAPPYQVGPLGRYYLPNSTPLFGGGSRSPGDAGLYHYTTRTNQMKDGEELGNHKVNIGLHYVATSGPGSPQPLDSDGDWIPDYVENRHGDGRRDWTDETDWQNAYTLAGVYDPTNTLYDDIDLSGDGLVGRLKKALGMNPFEATNPLALKQVPSGNEPELTTFEIPIPYYVLTNIGGLNLNLDGFDVTLEDCDRATNGNTLLTWNTTYEPPGQHCLQPRLAVNGAGLDTAILSGLGNLTPFYSSNVLRFFESDALYDTNGAYLDAQLAAQYATYTITLYDPSTTPRTPLKTITNSVSNGMIQEDWDLTCDDGTNVFTGPAFDAVFDVTLLDQPSGAPIAHGAPTKRHNKPVTYPEQGNGFDVAYMYTPTNSTLADTFDCGGPVWCGMQGVVDTLMQPTYVWPYTWYQSSFDFFTSWDHLLGYPGYVRSPTIAASLLVSLSDGSTKNFYCYAHGSTNGLADGGGGVVITPGMVASPICLDNHADPLGGIDPSYPYRFVFLDACSTAKDNRWRQAFGILTLRGLTDQAARSRLGPQAFVGWSDEIPDWLAGYRNVNGLDVNKSKAIQSAYTATLLLFFSEWMNGKSLWTCIAKASNPNYAQLPLPSRRFREYTIGPPYTTPYGITSFTVPGETKAYIWIYGHPGLTRNGLDPQTDGATSYDAPNNRR